MNFLKLMQEFRTCGCSTEAYLSAACYLYIELCEVRRKSNVKYYQHNQSDRMYLMANDDNRICDIYVPIPAAVDINLAEMAALEKSILAEHQIDPANFDGINFNLAIVDPNTTIVYYKLSSGLFDINSSQVVRKSH